MEEHHSIIEPTIAKGSTVLVTGVNGFIASHVADQLLEAGYNVRGTVRSQSKADWLYTRFNAQYGEGRFHAVEVPDLAHDGAFDKAVEGVSGICHVASVLTFSDKADEVIPPTVKGTLNILTAASKEASVKSVVYTSSSTAALLPQPNKEITVTHDTWNDAAVQEANTNPQVNAFTVYAASKTAAERAFWEAVAQTHPPFQTASVLPNANFGTIMAPGGEGASTASWPFNLVKGDTSMFAFAPPQYFINVRDTARLHVAALIDPACAGQRVFAFAAPFTWNEVLAVLRKLYPGKSLPEDVEMGVDLSRVPNADAEALLRKHYGHGFASLEQSLKENLATFKA